MRTLEEIDAEMDIEREHVRRGRQKLQALAKERDNVFYTNKLLAMPEAERNVYIIAAKSITSAEKFGDVGATAHKKK